VLEGEDGLSETEFMDEAIEQQKENYKKDVKSHEEILEIINEIKIFEEEFIESSIIQTNQIEFIPVDEDELIEIDQPKIAPEKKKVVIKNILKLKKDEFVTPSEQIDPAWETEEVNFKTRIQSLFSFIHKDSTDKQNGADEKIIYPAVFRIRFNSEGNLENIDFKKASPKADIKEDLQKINVIKKIKIKRKKGEKQESDESEGKGGKLSKLKAIGKISKIKNVIPKRGGKKEEKKEEEEE
jgi:hypothetical protein